MAGRLAGKTAFITAAVRESGADGARFAREGAQVGDRLNAKTLADLEGKDGIRTGSWTCWMRRHRQVAARSRAVDRPSPTSCSTARLRHHGAILDCTAKDWISASPERESMYLVTRALLPGIAEKGRRIDHHSVSIASSVKGLPNASSTAPPRPP